MLRKPNGKRTKKRYSPQNPRFKGIVAHAAKLGVSRIHLYFVLTGARKSDGLFQRYRELKRTEAIAK